VHGLERRVRDGERLAGIASVASFFVSRLDTKAEALLPEGSPLRGRIAIANAHRAYGHYVARFSGERWAALAAEEARPQRPLWASTGTKNTQTSSTSRS
jgi:transaldolase